MLEISVFNNWYYGTSLANIDEKALNIGVFNPEGVESLRNNPDIDLFVVYIIADDKVRLLRQLNREESPDCHEIVRRFSTDEQDFNKSRIELISPDCVIINNDKQNIDDLVKRFIMDYYNILGKIL